jgi:hypothetical protein
MSLEEESGMHDKHLVHYNLQHEAHFLKLSLQP